LSHRAAPAREISLPKEKARGAVGKTPVIGTRRRRRLPQYLVEKVLENGNIKRLWQSEKKSKGWYGKGFGDGGGSKQQMRWSLVMVLV
jgi:hypothetical protein